MCALAQEDPSTQFPNEEVWWLWWPGLNCVSVIDFHVLLSYRVPMGSAWLLVKIRENDSVDLQSFLGGGGIVSSNI